MPRNLPWLLDTTASTKPSSTTTTTTTTSSSRSRSRTSTPQPRRAGATSSSAAAAARTNAFKQTSSPPDPGSGGSRPRRRDFLRSSPTPPSSPIHRCPSEEYLIPGLPNDDIYMMVEDEFYSVAQSFTQHLHYAEYVRRKKEVKAQRQQQQNTGLGDLVRRPTDGVTPLSEERKKRHAQEELAARQRVGLETMNIRKRPVVSDDEEGVAEEEEEEEDGAWAGTSLHELMVSPRKNRSLVGVQGIRSATR
ncbi:hypothetical protein BP00DRAFT_381164, partial [Aspergillus indologenus CBS 114.80]